MAKGYKTGGREKGTPNKLTHEIRETLIVILEQEMKQLPALMESMQPEKRAEIVTRLLSFVVPKNTHSDSRDIIVVVDEDDILL